MKVSRAQPMILVWISLALPACNAHREKPHDEPPIVTVTTVQSKSVAITQRYICKIRSCRHITIRTLAEGYLAAITVREGQSVKQNDVLFQIRPLTDDKTLQIKHDGKLFPITAPFDGVIDRVQEQQGSLIREGDILTNLSDNSTMWVYFSVPEKRYLEYLARQSEGKQLPDVELMLPNSGKFARTGKIGSTFDNGSGNVAFRADFPNPDGLLRHDQTGDVLIKQELKTAIVIPQQATFEAASKRYVYSVDKDDVAHQREVVIQGEVDDSFVIESGIAVDDKIVVDGVKTVRDGANVKF